MRRIHEPDAASKGIGDLAGDGKHELGLVHASRAGQRQQSDLGSAQDAHQCGNLVLPKDRRQWEGEQ
jgi:hypothetical protein